MLKNLSVMNLNLFTPALLFSKMVDTLNPTMLLELWTEPVIYILYGSASLLWTRVGRKLLGIPGEYGRLLDVATFFSNTNTLPVSLIKSIAMSSGAAFLFNGPTDTKEQVAARGISYAMIFATMNNILRWSLGMILMGESSSSPSAQQKKSLAPHSINPSPNISYPSSANGSTTTIHNQGQSAVDLGAELLAIPHQSKDTQVINIDERTGLLSHSMGGPSSYRYPSSDDDDNTSVRTSRSDGTFSPMSGDLTMFVPTRTTPTLASRVKGVLRSIASGIKSCLNMPVYAILLAFVVICIPSFHAKFKSADSIFYTLWSTIDMCGDACVPIVLISLGGQLGTVKAKHEKAHSAENEANSSGAVATAGTAAPTTSSELAGQDVNGNGYSAVPMPLVRANTTNNSFVSTSIQNRGVILVMTGRFLFVPTISVCVLSFLRIYLPNAIPLLAEDPVFMLTLLILSATPPAINLITVAQATGKFEDEAALILLWSYLFGIAIMALEFSGFLWLTNVLKSVG
ncbi:hypothetical protein H4219_003875 [Mycoemilia scoparia]|uniref:Uncharacterized protein n=1 Tax=Mycoemilia scoparia TaxID=417184 RepID=A0A9W7ZZ71_9FUNG|nr:hypothetical protein H4219_003875 [Mycoemilia scoparia]